MQSDFAMQTYANFILQCKRMQRHAINEKEKEKEKEKENENGNENENGKAFRACARGKREKLRFCLNNTKMPVYLSCFFTPTILTLRFMPAIMVTSKR